LKDYDIVMVGLGYIGLPTAALFASKGKKVLGIDVKQDVVDIVNNGGIHIIEPGLESIVKTTTTDGFFSASAVPQSAGVFIIAVPTPFIHNVTHEGTPKPDVSYIKSAAIAISKVLKKGDLVILESTSPVGTTEKLAGWLAAERADLSFPHTASEDSDVRVAFCPERVLPGQVIKELVENDRIIGGMTERCSAEAIAVYKTFVEGEFFQTNAQTAEMTKLTENASRDVDIAFANELSVLCDSLNINVWELIRLANKHPRVNILKPGSGVGGHCIAVDPWFIISESSYDARIIREARHINDAKRDWVVSKVNSEIKNLCKKKPMDDIVVACLGLAFKPNIDDLRESPALYITQNIVDTNPGQVLVVEPNIDQLPKSLLGKAELCGLDNALAKASVLVILTNHLEFHLIKDQVSGHHLLLDFVGAGEE
jgi:UDP-N-acetyl-D-mannosaminuronic acid dehydrogenase